MKAMVLKELCSIIENPEPLIKEEVPEPIPGEDQILIKVSACGVCHTELDEIEGRTPPPRLPVIPGHQVVGRVENKGGKAKAFQVGDRVGAAWIHSACGKCEYCQLGMENLCLDFRATGRDADGGYAEYMVIPEGFAYALPEGFSDSEIAPLLCAGAIGYRSLRLAELPEKGTLGLTGFGASGHMVLKMVRGKYPDVEVYVFARNPQEQEFARELGAVWSGEIEEPSPAQLDSIIDTTPVWKPVLEGLARLKPGGRLVINAIRKEMVDQDYLLKLDYPKHLWMEKEIKSVANVARRDVSEFLALAVKLGIKPEFQEYPLEEANQALAELKAGKIKGAKVLRIK